MAGVEKIQKEKIRIKTWVRWANSVLEARFKKSFQGAVSGQ